MAVTIVSPTETAELLKMPFGMWIRMGRKNRVLDGVQIPRGKGSFEGAGMAHCKIQGIPSNYFDHLSSC